MKPIVFAMLALLMMLGIAAGQATQPSTAPASPRAAQSAAQSPDQDARPQGVQDLVAQRQAKLPGPGAKAVIIAIDGMIEDFTTRNLTARLKEAEELGANVIILEINTYGGMVTSGLDISRTLKQLNTPTVAFVREKAISAGSLIAFSCDDVVMEPATQIGDCGVIYSGATIEGETERAKAESPVLEAMYDNAIANHYPPAALQSMVRMDASLRVLVNGETGEVRWTDDAGYTELTVEDESPWKPLPDVRDPVDSPTSILTLSATTAEAIGIASSISPSVQSYITQMGWTHAATLSPGAGEWLVGMLGSYAISGVLTAVFLATAYMSLQTPGTGVPEVICAASLAVLLGVPALTGYAQWYEVLAVLLGVGLLAVEIFVIPGFGVAGGTGIALILAGLVMAYLPPLIVPSMPNMPVGAMVDGAEVAKAITTVLIALLASFGLWAWLMRYLPKTRYGRGMILTAVSGAPTTLGAREADAAGELSGTPLSTRQAIGMGDEGRATTDLRPGGVARFVTSAGPLRVDVVSDRGHVLANTPVVIVLIEGNRVVVRPV